MLRLAIIAALAVTASSSSSAASNTTAAAHLAASKAAKGPYSTSCKTYYHVPGMDSSDPTIDVYYPSGKSVDSNDKFPIVGYLHGLYGGDIADPVAYYSLLHGIASWGYVVVNSRACCFGCHDNKRTMPGDPWDFGNFYLEQLKSIEWARELASQGEDAVFKLVNAAPGAAIAGHSMGGQATLFSSSAQNATGHNIKAAVMHHAYTHAFPPPTVPFLAFTGTADVVAVPESASEIFDSGEDTVAHRGLVNKEHATHTEPIFDGGGDALTLFTVAWFKLYLDKTPQAMGVDFHRLLYGQGSTTLCGGGDGAMNNCTVL